MHIPFTRYIYAGSVQSNFRTTLLRRRYIRVHCLNAGTIINYKWIKTFSEYGEGLGEFKVSSGVALDKQDNGYVTEIGNDRVSGRHLEPLAPSTPSMPSHRG